MITGWVSCGKRTSSARVHEQASVDPRGRANRGAVCEGRSGASILGKGTLFSRDHPGNQTGKGRPELQRWCDQLRQVSERHPAAVGQRGRGTGNNNARLLRVALDLSGDEDPPKGHGSAAGNLRGARHSRTFWVTGRIHAV